MVRTESRQRVRFLGCPQRTTRVFKNILYLVIGCFAVIGFVGVVENGLSSFLRHSPDTAEWMPDSWGRNSLLSQQLARWPTDATADQQPIHCHSHNDYWRKVPLYSAIYVGCSSVEADVWLVDGELYVGHRRLALTSSRTLRNLYLNPLLTLLEKQNTQSSFYSNDDYPLDSNEKFPLNGVFDADPRRSFVLLIDFKSYGPALWWELNSQLSLFREKGYLTYYNSTNIVKGPITIVASGEAPFEWLTANETYRDIFFDAPLEELVDNSYKWPNPNRAQDSTRETGLRARKVNSVDLRGASSPTSTSIPWPGNMGDDDKEGWDVQNLEGNTSIYNSTNSYYASVSFTAAVGHVWGSRLSQKQLQLIRSQIRGAHQQGLKVRYWGVPRWPLGLRNHIWHILMREGADVLSVDNLYAATQTDWRKKRSWDWPS